MLINKATIRIEKTSPNYKKLIAGSFVFNFDTTAYNQAPVLSICVSNDRLFFGDSITGIYQMSIYGLTREIVHNNNLSGGDKTSVELPAVNGYTTALFESDCSVYCAKYANGLIYIATSDGIKILNNDLTLYLQYNTQMPVKDIAISDDGKYLYTAECDDGVGIYSIDGSDIKKLSNCTDKSNYNFTVTSITLTNDGNFIIAQSGFSRISTVDIHDKFNPIMTNMVSGGSMYYRNLCQGTIAEKYSAVCDGGKITLFSSNSTSLSTDKILTNTVGTETNGMAAYGNYIVAVYNNGYVYFDPITETNRLSSLPLHKVPEISWLRGKPAIYVNIMVVSYCYGKQVTIVDISDLDNPVLITQMNIDASIDVATITDNLILIPLRNDGLLVLKKS